MFALTAGPARAATAYELYVAGKFPEAEAAALAQGNAAGYALAARADLAAEMMRPEPCRPCLEHAEMLARHAVDLDPKLAEGQIEYVVAMGYKARLMGLWEARDLADEAKNHIDAAIADNPADAWAWAALGGWNIEVTRKAGSALAHWLFGANIRAGLEDFSKAFVAAPDNLVVRYQYALSLASYNRKAYRDAIEDALSHAIADAPGSAYEIFARNNARELLAALKSGDTENFDRLVRHDQGYP